MLSSIPWNPFKNFSRIAPVADFDDFFRSFGLRSHRPDAPAASDIRINLSEDGDAFYLEAEIPGVEKEDIDVSVNNDWVIMSASIRPEIKEKGEYRELCRERHYGRIYRSITLPGEVDIARASAHYENGVLRLNLPKKQNGNIHRLTVT